MSDFSLGEILPRLRYEVNTLWSGAKRSTAKKMADWHWLWKEHTSVVCWKVGTKTKDYYKSVIAL